MLETLKKYKTILIVLVIAVGGFFVYQQFFAGNAGTPLLLSEDASGGTAAGESLIQLLDEVKQIQFDTEFLQSSVFTSLVDFTESIRPEPVGRTNPFDPIGIGIDMYGVDATPTIPVGR